jgi:hypothetical protein
VRNGIHTDARNVGLQDISLNESEPTIGCETRHIFGTTSGQIVNTGDFVTAVEQDLTKVRTEESGAAGYDDMHFLFPFFG